MNTIAIFHDAAGSHGQECHLRKLRLHIGCRTATGLWITLALVASGMIFSSTATAQDDSWLEQPRRQPRTIAQNYPDEELPSSEAAPNDDGQRRAAPVPDGTVDSPSNQRSRKKKAEPAGEAVPDDGPQAVPGIPLPPRRPGVVDEGNTLGPDEPFGNSSEGDDESDFGCNGLRLARKSVESIGFAVRRCCGGSGAGRRRRC